MSNPSVVQRKWFDDMSKDVSADPVIFKDDPVVLACASYRCWITNFASRWLDFDAVTVQTQDRETAAALKQYYRGRMTFQALRTGMALSAYRKKLAAIVNDTHNYTRQDIGILHRLPYFYVEDQAVDQVFAVTSNAVTQVDSTIEFQGKLQPLHRVLRSRRAGDFIDFYWSSDQSSAPYLLPVRFDNPLRSMIEAMFKNGPISAKAWSHRKIPHGYHSHRMYYQLSELEVLQS